MTTAVLKNLTLYLERFPEERPRLAVLISQLEEDKGIDSRKNFRGHLTGSALCLDPASKKVLLVHHKSLDLWIQPGGHLEPGELPIDAALREFQEETGIGSFQLSPFHQDNHHPLDIDTHFIPANSKKNEPSHYHHDFLYLVISEGASARDINESINKEELHDHRWIDLDELSCGNYEEKLKRAASKLTASVVQFQ